MQKLSLFSVLFFLLPSVIYAQGTLTLLPGDVVADGTDIPDGTIVNVNGGSIGLGVDLSNGELNINSGSVAAGANSIGTGFTNTNNLINLSGGEVGGFFQLIGGTELNITGGSIESFGLFNTETIVNIEGGTVTRFPDNIAGTVNIRGGDVFSTRTFAGGTLNVFGSNFALNGAPIADLSVGQAFTIEDRNVTLTATLTDGSIFETDLNTSFGSFSSDNPDGASASATITVTVVADPVLLGDVNLDQTVDFSDISDFISILSINGFQAEADFDGNGMVDFSDISPFIAALSGS